MAASKKHETSAGVVCHMDAGALRRVAEDPDWKVRRAGRAAINAVARYLGPEIGIAADSGRDPMEVCEIVQAFRERFELAAEALAEEATADFRRGPNTRSQPGRLAVKLMQ